MTSWDAVLIFRALHSVEVSVRICARDVSVFTLLMGLLISLLHVGWFKFSCNSSEVGRPKCCRPCMIGVILDGKVMDRGRWSDI